MLWTMFVMLMALWLLGMASAYTFGGFIHFLLLAAVVLLVLNFVLERKQAL